MTERRSELGPGEAGLAPSPYGIDHPGYCDRDSKSDAKVFSCQAVSAAPGVTGIGLPGNAALAPYRFLYRM